MSESKLNLVCPSCNDTVEVEASYQKLFPRVRSLITPTSNILVYKISSAEIAQFITKKAKFYKEEAKIEVVALYCEKKNAKPHRGYASLRIGFSDDVLEKRGKVGWYEKIATEGSDQIRFIDDIFIGMIKKYQYDTKALNNILGNYKTLEQVEQIGLSEAFIEDIKLYSTPRRIPTNNNESWILFSARAEKVIEDMLEDPDTDKVSGKIEIHDVYSINKDLVEFIVYVHPQETKSAPNPYVRKIMMGEAKVKKMV